jgi:Ca2+/Na+ antiporter
MKNHVTLLAALRIGWSAMGIITAIIVFVAVVGGGLISGDETAIAITSLVGSIIATIILVLSLPGLVAGIGLLRLRPWSRFLTLVLAVFDLMAVPIGTAFGLYAIWVLVQEETVALFEGKVSA